MTTLEVFFDYACPYCMRAHEHLLQLIPKYPQMQVVWRPCEAHPRPERHGPHSDICARGMYFALENGADIMEYHARMFSAALKDHANIEDLQLVTKLTDGLLDFDAFYAALSGGAYMDKLNQNNKLAWQVYNFPAVPSYTMNGEILKCRLAIGVDKQALASFIEKNL